MYSHFISYLGFCSTEGDQVHNAANLYVADPILSIPFLLMAWRLKLSGHQEEWDWPNEPEYSISGIRRVNSYSKRGFSMEIYLSFVKGLYGESGDHLNIKMAYYQYGIPIINRRWFNRLIFIMGIPQLQNWSLYWKGTQNPVATKKLRW